MSCLKKKSISESLIWSLRISLLASLFYWEFSANAVMGHTLSTRYLQRNSATSTNVS